MDDQTSVPSPWLAKLPITLQELSSTNSEALKSDIPIVVLNPLSSDPLTHSSTLYRNPHSLVVINATASESTTHLAQKAIDALPNNLSKKPRVLFVDVDRALRAVDTLQKDPSSSTSIQAYQQDYLNSNFSEFISALEERVSMGPERLRKDARTAVVLQIVYESRKAIEESNLEIIRVRRILDDFRGELQLQGENEHRAVLGAAEGNNSAITEAVGKAAKDITPVIAGLKWWKLPMIVDDITYTVSQAVEKAYTKQFANIVSVPLFFSILSFFTDTRFIDPLSLPSTQAASPPSKPRSSPNPIQHILPFPAPSSPHFSSTHFPSSPPTHLTQ